ncbi:MAG TPA: stage II sporulation protein R [Firmicutes bacterium]|nr:stage II sporulation protein R [Bacillota bacterium]
MDTEILKVRFLVSFCLLVAAVLLGFTIFALTSYLPNDTAFAKDLIRLHVLANSNLPKDQDLKLLVRDAILLEAGRLLAAADNKVDAHTILEQNKDRIKAAAQETVLAHGFDYPVRVETGSFAFPERAYGRLILPAGSYDALRVEIGRAAGENWWCVLFPPLCLADLKIGEYHKPPLNQAAGKRIVFRLKFLDQLAQTRYAQTIQRWWQASAAGYLLLAK